MGSDSEERAARPPGGRSYRIAELVYRADTGEVVDGPEVRRLRPQAAAALNCLLARPGELVEREELISRLWPHGAIEGDLGLNACIRQIRAALGDDAANPVFLETLRGRGYRLIAPVEACTPPRTSGGGPVSPAPRHQTRPIGAMGAIGGAVVAVLALALGTTFLRPAGPEVRTGLRLAVVPGTNQTSPELDAARHGLHEDLLTTLAGVEPERLLVVGGTSVSELADQGLNTNEIAERLELDLVLEATVRPASDGYRVSLRLLEVESDVYTWSGSAEAGSPLSGGPAHDLIDDLMARLSVGTPGVEATAAPPPHLRTALLQARYLRSLFTREDSRRAVALLEAALGSGPAHPAVLVELARNRLVLGETDLARVALERARASDAATAHLDHVEGRLHLYGEVDVEAALHALERAVRSSPGSAEVRHDLAHALTAAGRLDEAARHARIALELDPVSSVVLGDMGWVLYYAGAYRESGAACEGTLALRPESIGARKCVVLSAAQDGSLSSVADHIARLGGDLDASPEAVEELRRAARDDRTADVWDWLVSRGGSGLSPLDRARVLSLAGRNTEAAAILADIDRSSVAQLMALQDPLFRGR